MEGTSPFQVIFIVTGVMILLTATFAIIAPSLGINTPEQPIFPVLADLSYNGNYSADWAFNETHAITTSQEDGVIYTAFSPDKRCVIRYSDSWTGALGVGYFVFQKWGFPIWYTEPVKDESGVDFAHFWDLSTFTDVCGPSAQRIVDDFNGSYSTYIIDDGNSEYMAYASFSPLDGYDDMVDSWNIGRGFNVMIYGNAYEPPSWDTQVVNVLGWIASVIVYFMYFIGYLFATLGLFFTVLGLIPALSSALAGLIIIVFIGSILMFLRGNQQEK